MSLSTISQTAHGLAAPDSDDELPPVESQALRPYFLIRQDVTLEVNFREKRIEGKTELTIVGIRGSSMDEIAIDARQSVIDVANIEIEVLRDTKPLGPPRKIAAIYEDPYERLDYPPQYNWNATHHDVRRFRMLPLIQAQRHEAAAEDREAVGSAPVDGSIRINLKDLDKGRDDSGLSAPKRPGIKLRLSSANPAASGTEPDLNPHGTKEYRITIPFTTKKFRDGLQFVGVEPGDLKWPHVYTRHSIDPGTASCIFPCIDDHGQRCSWSISLKFPRTLGDALRQPLATQNGGSGHARTGGQKSHHPVPDSDNDFALSEEDKLLEMTAICSGVVAEESIDPVEDWKKVVKFELDKKASVQMLGFAIGPFEMVDVSAAFRTEAEDEKLGTNALKIQAFCLPGRADEVLNTCQAIPSAADFFTLTFARYPFEEYRLCFVEDMVEDTVSLHSLSFATTRLLYPENVVDPAVEVEVTRKLVHTLATQWSGINLLPSKREDLWVVVGIAYYMTDLYLKKLCGNNDYRFRIKTMVDELVTRDVDRPPLYELGQHLHLGHFEKDFLILKAPLVMFILDKRLTKAPAQTNLTRIVSRILYKANIGERQADNLINTESFRRVCEKNAKNKLESFWKQWIYGSGCPKFEVTQKFNKKKLCVEMLVRQVQSKDSGQKRDIEKPDFLRIVKERQYGVQKGELQPWFTGPMTIRIHEADGTPYEHIVEVREDAAATKQCKYDIPYNTKYKRLKRSRRQRDRAVAQTNVDGETTEDTLLYCLGDVLQTPEDVQEWKLLDWPAEMEKKMDQESYEWIRMDADFEWICTMKTNSESYMYVSQLQQDRDVVAQQDTMLFLGRAPAHPLVSSILTRTLVDRRYFHGIRTMACSQLPRHNVAGNKDPMIGLYHLLRTFSKLCCFPNTHMPRPNDFSDRKQYLAQCAIPMAVARVRDGNGKSPHRARRFLLDQIKYNNNANNAFSDNFYVAKLLDALATSLIPEKRGDGEVTLDDAGQTEEEQEFLQEALTEIDRYRRMDEWANSYHNIWTTTALDCKQRLMKAGVMPKNGLDFVQYLQDETYDLVRIKAFEALVDLGFLMDDVVLPHLLRTLSTDKSPFVRHKLLEVFSLGLAGLAIGEFTQRKELSRVMDVDDNLLLGFPEDDVKDDMLVVESGDTAGDKETKERHVEAARKYDVDIAVEALKKEIKDQFSHNGLALQKAVWNAINQDSMGLTERLTLLDFCTIMFEPADEFILTLRLPERFQYLRAHRSSGPSGRYLVTFKKFFRAEPTKKEVVKKEPIIKKPLPESRPVPPPPRPAPSPAPIPAPISTPIAKPAEPKRVIVNPKVKLAKPGVAAPVRPSVNTAAPAAPAVVASPKPPSDSIVATPVRTIGVASPATAPPRTELSSKLHKRPRPDHANGSEGSSLPPHKRTKLTSKPPSSNGDRPATATPIRRMVTLRHPDLKRILKQSQRKSPSVGDSVNVAAPRKSGSPFTPRASPAPSASHSSSSSIQAKVARKPLPGSAAPNSSSLSSKLGKSPAPSVPRQPLPQSSQQHNHQKQSSPLPRDINGQSAPKRPKIVIKRPGAPKPSPGA